MLVADVDIFHPQKRMQAMFPRPGLVGVAIENVMGKGRDGKKRRDKPPKAQKEPKKRHRNESSDSEDLDAIVETFKKLQKQEFIKASVETVDGSDAITRVNCAVQGSSEGILIFGGEWTDGRRTRFFGDLLRYNVMKDQWRMTRTGMAPTPRSSIHSVTLGNHMYVFGGEFGSSRESSFVHFKELWRLDLETLSWEQLQPLTESGDSKDNSMQWPCARSGHRMTVKQGRIYLFGGFKSSGRDITYLDDFWCYDDFRWSRLKGGPGARSGFQMHAIGDAIYLYGGYCIEQGKRSSTAKILTDMWTYKDSKWEQVRVLSSLNAPPRSGASSFVYKNRMYLFGGIVDTETSNGFLCGQCLSDLHEYNAERGSWRKVELCGEAIHPRYNATTTIIGNKAYIIGGLFEVGDVVVVLDDMYSVNMNKMEVERIKALTVTIPKPVHEKEESSGEGSEGDSDESSSESSSSESDMEAEGVHPMPLEGQSLKDYFASTMEHWQAQVDTCHDSKTLRGLAFQLAQAHFAACSLAEMEISSSD